MHRYRTGYLSVLFYTIMWDQHYNNWHDDVSLSLSLSIESITDTRVNSIINYLSSIIIRRSVRICAYYPNPGLCVCEYVNKHRYTYILRQKSKCIYDRWPCENILNTLYRCTVCPKTYVVVVQVQVFFEPEKSDFPIVLPYRNVAFFIYFFV